MALAGGWAMLTGLLAPLLVLAALWPLGLLEDEILEKAGHGFRVRFGQLAVLLGGAVGMVVLGWLDDKHELRPLTKFAGQLAVAAGVAAAGVRITLFVADPWFSHAMTVLWMLTVINAFNFLDNMNGLCAGVGAMGAFWFGAMAALQTHYLVAALAFLITGALVGFLPFNFPRASVFLGDAGSHLVGYWLAVLAILPHFYSPANPHPWAVCSPLLILAVPLGDLAWVVLLRWRAGRPFYVGDTNHWSHRLVQRGFTPAQAVLILWLLAGLIGSLALVWQI